MPRKQISLTEASKKGTRIEFKTMGRGISSSLSNVFKDGVKKELEGKTDAQEIFKILKKNLLYQNSCKVVPSLDKESFCSFKVTDGVGGEYLLKVWYALNINENKVQIQAKAPKLREGEKRYILTVSDPDKSILNLLLRVQEAANWGHGFPVSVDPNDKEYKRDFYIDGDGMDHIYDITIEEGPVEED